MLRNRIRGVLWVSLAALVVSLVAALGLVVDLPRDGARAEGVNFIANLEGGQEVPPVVSDGTGRFTATLNETQTELAFTLNVEGLDLSRITAAHIHVAPIGVNGPIIFFLYNPATQGAFPGFKAGTLTATDLIPRPAIGINAFSDAVAALLAGNAYVNVHTVEHPGGEIRGQITPLQSVKKDPDLANLWLCNTGALTCDNKASGVEEVNLDVELTAPVSGRDPKCTGFPNFRPPEECDRQSIGAFEFEVRYDAKLVSVKVEPGSFWFVGNPRPVVDPNVSCATTQGEAFVQLRCVTKGKERVVYGPGTLAVVRVRATPEVYSILVPNQLNGIATQLINQDCQLADLQGHPIALGAPDRPADPCGDAAITIRYLEGDVHADCLVDVHDQQQIAFRWGSQLGQLLYNDRFDLEPSQPKKGDGDIDAKDLQLVYGRHGSTCKDPHPPQEPVDPKAKVEPPPATATPTPTAAATETAG